MTTASSLFNQIIGEINNLLDSSTDVSDANGSISEGNKEQIQEKLEKIVDEIGLQVFNENLLNGHYVSDSFSKEIHHIIAQIDKILNPFSDNIFDSPILKRLSDLKSSLYHFIVLLGALTYTDDKIEYTVNSRNSSYIYRNQIDNKLDLISITCSNLQLIFCEHNLSVTDRELNDCLEHIEKKYKGDTFPFMEGDTLNIIKRISIKAKFLRRKIILRKIEELSSSDTVKIVTRNGAQKFDIEVMKQTALLSQYFNKWFEKIYNHYEINVNYRHHFNFVYDKTSLSDLNTLNLGDIHTAIKYYKDISKEDAVPKFEEILEILVAKKSIANDQYQRYCINLAILYCYNNLISYLLDKGRHADLMYYYERLLSLSDIKKMSTFFATGKVIKSYTTQIENLFLNNELDIKACTKLVRDCNKLLVNFERQTKWHKNHIKFLYLLPCEEAIIQTDFGPIFFFSHYALPTTDNYLKTKFEAVINDFNSLKSVTKNLEILGSKLSSIEQGTIKIDQIKDDIEKKETRTLELVAIIGALLGFIAGSVPGFQFIKDAHHAILFTLALGTSLSFFVFLMILFNRGKDYIINNDSVKILIVLYFLFLTITWYKLN